MIVLRTSCSAQSVIIPNQEVPKIDAKSVLQLLYSVPQQQRRWGDKHLTFYDNVSSSAKPDAASIEGEIDPSRQEPLLRGKMIATDSKGWLYFYDPITYNSITTRPRQPHRAIRVFNRRGQEMRRWWLPPNTRVLRAEVTGSGVLWLGVQDESYPYSNGGKPTLPLLAYAPNDAQPVVNWTKGLPRPISQFLAEQIKGIKLNREQREELFRFYDPDLMAGLDTVLIDLSAVGGRYGVPSRKVSVQTDSRGHNVKIIPSLLLWKVTSPLLSPSGRYYHFDSDDDPKHPVWSKLWFWWDKQQKKSPLLTREIMTNPSGWWQKVLHLNFPYDQIAYKLDGRGNIYLTVQRYSSDDGLFVVRNPTGGSTEVGLLKTRAEVVINAARQVVGYIPWRKTMSEETSRGIFPVPDGSGFYRQEYGPKSLNIYWHPLPNFKPARKKR